MSKILTDPGFLPLSSLRLIVPPLQLVSAVLLEMVKQGAVTYYGLLDEFVTTVLDTVPELLTFADRVQLVLGLRAKVVLELCRSEDFTGLQAVQPHLSRINTYINNQHKENSSSEVKASAMNFLKLAHTLVDDQSQRNSFYQKIFPTVFGPKYDAALQALIRKFLFSLQKLLPVPSLEQTSLWLSLSPSILKDCVDFMSQPEPLNTLIQHHKHHGHPVPQALSSSTDDCILSSLSFHLPNVDSNDGDTLNLPENESKQDKEENVKHINSELMVNVDRNGQQHIDEERGASVEVILESNNDDVMNKKWLHQLKAGSGTSTKTFKCLVCGQDFGSFNKLRKHKATCSSCFTDKVSLSHSASQSFFFEKINLHPKPKTCIKNNVSRSDAELLSLASATTHNPSNMNSLPNTEQSNDDLSLVCHTCGKVFTYPKNFDKHQRICVVSSKQQAQTDPQCTRRLAQHSKPNPVDKTEELLPSETETGPSNVVPQESIALDSPQEQTFKRSSRVKQCSICGKVFTCSADLTRHMRYHTEQGPYLCSYCGKNFDNSDDWETHQECKCRGSNDNSQDNHSSKANKSNQENAVVLSCVAQIQTITDAPTNLQAMQACKSPLTCQECGQGFTYHKSFEKHQSKCSKRRKKRANSNHFIISACNFRLADNTSGSHAETSSETKGSDTANASTSADHVDGSKTKSRTIKCTMCEKNFSEIVHMKRHYSKSHKVRGSYPCPLCKTAFVRLCELVRHQQNKKLYQCAACKKCYTKPGLLNDHEKVHMANVTPRICETCGKSFKSLAYLILHQNKHKERQPSVCSYCGKQFSTKDCLRAHMVRHTGGYPCPVCGKKFYQKTYLKWHLYKHTGQEPYLCDTCGKGWPSAAQLKLHMIQHTEERPFKCEDCGACYKRGSHLMAHHRAKHIQLRPFVCEVCSKAFRLNNELKKHMMVHTGERPFTCPRCGKTFTRKSRLREHREKACL